MRNMRKDFFKLNIEGRFQKEKIENPYSNFFSKASNLCKYAMIFFNISDLEETKSTWLGRE